MNYVGHFTKLQRMETLLVGVIDIFGCAEVTSKQKYYSYLFVFFSNIHLNERRCFYIHEIAGHAMYISIFSLDRQTMVNANSSPLTIQLFVSNMHLNSCFSILCFEVDTYPHIHTYTT